MASNLYCRVGDGLDPLVIVLIVGAGFSCAGARGPWKSVIWLFAILFFATLAIGV